jgi:alanine racemase
MTVSRRTFIAASATALAAHRAQALSGAPGSIAATTPSHAPGAYDPWLEIDESALAHNVATLSRLVGGRLIFAVAKNNAYGCGLTTVGPILDRLSGVAGIAVVRGEEALVLRDAGVRKPVLLMGPASDEEALALARLNVRLATCLEADRDRIIRLSHRLGRPVQVHLYVDTGMHRMGMPYDQVLTWLDNSTLRRAMTVDGVFTELTEDPDFDRQQVLRLLAINDAARSMGYSLGRLHAASSDAIARPEPETFLDAVRPGLTIYGGYPTPEMMARGELRPVYRLKARVLRVDTLEPGEGVSYHRRYAATQTTRIATLGLGHVDGYPTGAVKGCAVLLGGRLRPVIGTVSASHTVVVLGGDETVRPGDEAIAVGPDDPAIHPNEVAKRSDWSEYNVFMHLNPSLPRIVRGDLGAS